MIKPASVKAAAVVALLAVPAPGHAAEFFVGALGSTLTGVLNADDPSNKLPFDHQSFNSGHLPQLSVSTGIISSSSQGSFHSSGVQFQQRADASFSGTASIGALHAVVAASTDTNHAPTNGLTEAQASTLLTWSDTVFFQSSRVGGSDFTISLTLDDLISFANSFARTSTSFASGRVVAQVTKNGGFFLVAQDLATQTAISHPFSLTDSATLHVVGGETLTFTGTLELDGTVSDAVDSINLNASDTALFTIFSADPDAAYGTASGVRFTPDVTAAVPEPSSWALLLVGFAGLAGLRRHLRGRQAHIGSNDRYDKFSGVCRRVAFTRVLHL